MTVAPHTRASLISNRWIEQMCLVRPPVLHTRKEKKSVETREALKRCRTECHFDWRTGLVHARSGSKYTLCVNRLIRFLSDIRPVKYLSAGHFRLRDISRPKVLSLVFKKKKKDHRAAYPMASEETSPASQEDICFFKAIINSTRNDQKCRYLGIEPLRS